MDIPKMVVFCAVVVLAFGTLIVVALWLAKWIVSILGQPLTQFGGWMFAEVVLLSIIMPPLFSVFAYVLGNVERWARRK